MPQTQEQHENRFVSIEAQLSRQSDNIDRLVTTMHETNVLLAESVKEMRHMQAQVDGAHGRIDKLSDKGDKRHEEHTKMLMNLTVSQEKLSGAIQRNVMTRTSFIGWLVIGMTAILVLYSSIEKVIS